MHGASTSSHPSYADTQRWRDNKCGGHAHTLRAGNAGSRRGARGNHQHLTVMQS